MDPWCCDTYEETLVYFRDPGTILCGKCSDTEGINYIPVWGIPNINTRFKANRLHRVTEIILRFWGKFHLDSREISLRSSSYQDEVSGASRIYMEISSLYCLRCGWIWWKLAKPASRAGAGAWLWLSLSKYKAKADTFVHNIRFYRKKWIFLLWYFNDVIEYCSHILSCNFSYVPRIGL